MIKIRCKSCNKELVSHSAQTKCCGCQNMTTLVADRISALDLSQVIIVESDQGQQKDFRYPIQDIEWSEKRRQRKITKLDFEVR